MKEYQLHIKLDTQACRGCGNEDIKIYRIEGVYSDMFTARCSRCGLSSYIRVAKTKDIDSILQLLVNTWNRSEQAADIERILAIGKE